MIHTAATGAACPRNCLTYTSLLRSQIIQVLSRDPDTTILYGWDDVRHVTVSLCPYNGCFSMIFFSFGLFSHTFTACKRWNQIVIIATDKSCFLYFTVIMQNTTKHCLLPLLNHLNKKFKYFYFCAVITTLLIWASFFNFGLFKGLY